MPPLGLLVTGMVLVGVDISFNGLDLVPDVIGWPIVLLGLGRLAGRNAWFLVALASAATGLLVAVLDLIGVTGTLLDVLDLVAWTGLVFSTCTAIIALVVEPEVERTGNQIRWMHLGLVVLTVTSVGVLGDGVGALGVALVVLGLAVGVWFLVFCWRQRDRTELAPAR